MSYALPEISISEHYEDLCCMRLRRRASEHNLPSRAMHLLQGIKARMGTSFAERLVKKITRLYFMARSTGSIPR